MKKQMLKHTLLLAGLCIGLAMGNPTVRAAAIEDGTEAVVQSQEASTEESVVPEEVIEIVEPIATQIESAEEEAGEETEEAIPAEALPQDNVEELTVQGLEGLQIAEIKDITLSMARSSCGVNHVWSVTSVIQEGSCDKQGIYKVQCTVCGATGTVYTDAPGHNYVNGVCTVCGERQGVEVAPAEELAKWTYELNETDKTITLKKYTGNIPEVIVYGAYKINGIIYDTILNGGGSWDSFPFYENQANLNSIVINNGVKSTDCRNLFYLKDNKLVTLDVSSLDTSNVTGMSSMFYGCSDITALDVSNFDTSNVTNMSSMFSGCTNLTSLDLSNFDTSQVTSMTKMFYNCNSITVLDVGSFDTSQVTSMASMFTFCESIANLDLKNFITSKVENMSCMFWNCYALKSLNVSSFDTSNVTAMNVMFTDCKSLTELNISNFNTSKVKNMYEMFYRCENLTCLDVSNFDASNVTNMKMMFYRCTSLEELDLSSFQTYNAEDMTNMFENCTNLTTIYVNRKNWNTSFADTTDMFKNCGTSRVTPK